MESRAGEDTARACRRLQISLECGLHTRVLALGTGTGTGQSVAVADITLESPPACNPLETPRARRETRPCHPPPSMKSTHVGNNTGDGKQGHKNLPTGNRARNAGKRRRRQTNINHAEKPTRPVGGFVASPRRAACTRYLEQIGYLQDERLGEGDCCILQPPSKHLEGRARGQADRRSP